MTDLYVEGPDALKVFSDLGVNSFKNFKVNQAKQFVACNHDGYVIGDAILFYLDDNKLSLVGRPSASIGCSTTSKPAATRRQPSETSGPPSTRARESSSDTRCRARTRSRSWRKSLGKPAPDIRFFNMDVITIAGRDVHALRHGMVGQPGWELFGPWEHGEAVRDAIVAGRPGVRDSASRRENLPDELPRIGLDSFAASGGLCRRRDEAVPAVAEREELRSHGVARRQLLLQRHHRLLPDAVRSRLRTVRQVRPRFRRTRRRSRKWPSSPKRKKVTLVWNGEDIDARLRLVVSRRTATSRSTSTCRWRTIRRCRTTRC